MSLKLYGIPNCGTCQKAFQWLADHHISYEFINTKEAPPSREMIASWVTTLGAKPLRNTSGKSYRELGPEKQSWDDARWIEAFARDAMLLKRPVFVQADRAVLVGFRQPEAVLLETLK